MTNNPQITVEVTPSLATTTDGTSTVTVLTVPMHDSTGAEAITFDIVGYDFSNNDVASAKVCVKVTNTGGTLAMVGTPVHLVPIQVGSSTSLSTASVNVIISGSNVLVNVIGVTGKTIKWVAYRNPAIEVLNAWTAVTSPSDGYINSWEASNTRWNPISRAALISGLSVGGDLSGTLPNPTVIKIDGASVPAAGSLTTGNVLQVSGSSALSYGPVNLAGGSNYVTGGLPVGGDISGTHSAATVIKLQGRTVVSTAPSDGYVLAWSAGSSNWYPAAGVPGPPSGAATGDLGGLYPNPTVVGITGTAGAVAISATNFNFASGITFESSGTINLQTSSSTGPIQIMCGDQTRYGLQLNGANLPGIVVGSTLTNIQWDAPGGGANPYHDFTIDIKSMGASNPSVTGKDFYLTGQSGGTGGSAANGGQLILSSGLAGTSGVDGYIQLRNGTTNRISIGPSSIGIGGPTISFPDITTTTSANIGGASALPALPVGYVTVIIGGIARKIPFYGE